ncbi:MAG: iron chelate uptake ABC transporter family permease subunit, partial [Polyangiales bacterium]
MRLYAFLFLLLLIAGALAVLVGSGDLSDPELRDTFLKLRGFRLAAAFLAGAALAVGGVVVQGLFRNPLASPSVLGTTAGASFGGQVALLLYGLSGV